MEVLPVLVAELFTGKSFSEALIIASTNPQYDKRLFIVEIKGPESWWIAKSITISRSVVVD